MRRFQVNVNGTSYDVTVEEIDDISVAQTVSVPVVSPTTHTVKQQASKVVNDKSNIKSGETVTAPMPGTIVNVLVSEGQLVKSGDVILVLEAMKMENEIASPRDAKVIQVAVAKGASVNTGDVLVVLE